MKTALSTPDGPDRKNTVSKALTASGKPRKAVENKEFAAFNRRIVRAFARRVADGDIEALRDLASHADEVDNAIKSAISGLREEYGYSWTDIGNMLGVTKQSAQRRWGGQS